ncbi:MAG: bifunctional glutamate N-acetyltransferase/amino-acid acetyltransferase ArgJ [Azospirillaceae bacterium]
MATNIPVSPLAPTTYPKLPPIAGVRLTGEAIGLKRSGRPDLMMAVLDPGTAVAGTLTRSQCPSAPVDWCRQVLPRGTARALVVNSGNANAFTGSAGVRTTEATARMAAEVIGCDAQDVLLASTGVIGEPLDPRRITDHLRAVEERLADNRWDEAAAAIRTTDTFAKLATRQVTIDGNRVTVNGFAKGSGMIAPNMATMLAFIFTDADVSASVLQRLTRAAVDRSFNAITVDSDTSTSDTCLVFATRKAGHAPITAGSDRRLGPFRRALEGVMLDLAHLIVKDGEGAQKFITINVTGATSARAARRIGHAIGNSPLVKTAIAGEDANWGRIVMAVGKSGEKADRDRLSVSIGGVEIARRGDRVTDYDETPVSQHMRGRDIVLDVDLGVGRGKATVWTCDLTHGYISINADYRS